MALIKTVSGNPVQTDGLLIGVTGEKLGFAGKTPVAVPEVADDANVAAVVTALKALGLFVTPA